MTDEEESLFGILYGFDMLMRGDADFDTTLFSTFCASYINMLIKRQDEF